MRQAGRYLPEYRAVRAKAGGFLEMVHNPELASEVTLQPIRRFGMDVAVIFSDILVPVAAMGVPVAFDEGLGPRLKALEPTREAIESLEAFDPEEKTPFVAEIIRRVKQELGDGAAIMGFAGAPFTTCSYMLEGGSSREFPATRRLMHSDPQLFSELLERTTDALIPYLGMQVFAGADALQIFDSWGGTLDAETWRRHVFPSTERLVAAAKALGVPVTLYGSGADHLLEALADAGPDVVSLDWRTSPASARARVGERVALQGNMDPGRALSTPEVAAEAARATLTAFGSAPGHIFNFGSGISRHTPPECMAAVSEVVKHWRPS
jgi:uroporphyrinogen decarboxylase